MLQRVRAQLRQVAAQMARRPELCCGAILLTCALLLPITLTCSRAKNVVALARPPVRFFPAEVPVVDLFLGQIEEADRLREEADVSLVFYYAPWCAHSITARQHVQQVALRLAGQGVVGYFQFNSSPQPAAYITFLLSALHALRRDHQGAVRFAVVTNQAVAEGVSLREDESVFPRAQRNFTVQAVCDWVFENRESVIHWIQPTRAKSYSLEAELQRGPALLTFLPHNPLTANQLLNQVTDVALRYHSCCGSEDGASGVARCCRSLLVSGRASAACDVCVSHCWALGLYVGHVELSGTSCGSVQSSYSPFGQFSVCCRSVPKPLRCPLLSDSITGLQCRTNKTLHFYLLDAQLHWPLAQRLGAVSYSPLHRHLVGHKQHQHTQSLIQEVTSDSFLDTVMDSQRDVLLLYYSAWCGFCSLLNHVFLQLARLVNVGRNDLPWEFMVDHLPSVLFFPRHRKQMSVKFPENTPMTVPNLLRFVLQHASHAPWEESGDGVESVSLLGAELHSLQREVFSLHRARERLSQQLAVLWRENRRLTLHTHTLETQNAELQAQSGRLETLYREKRCQLADSVHRLQELADASEELLKENSLLKVLLSALRDKDTQEGKCEAS
ncbi:Thioredoxin domain-containing protein 11 [Anabarilius grahami]|uniref:Thioredoxin domain-containing protein 11 n=1 Tax=Anabarilius grahami TaxID=495550 RepID=A0A3N0XR64_ANAGA|nr:Thioredoxin domain-containing protein 11 [Anabarilius grahami]